MSRSNSKGLIVSGVAFSVPPGTYPTYYALKYFERNGYKSCFKTVCEISTFD